ncbi:bile acid:sodium symporter family protein [Aureisphaera galaxeae]|uniref:bile acid:sodium symporter family protein n=1 Tax=Aureisphaera galaxeae TaxID=1538023 RepID=UPI003AF32CB7
MDKASTIILAVSLIIIMFGMGLSLTTTDFRRVIFYPKAIFIGLINQLILLPLIGFSIAVGLNLPADIAIGVMILAACPGGPTSNLISHLAKGDLALSVTLTALSSLITILTIPFLVNFALEYFSEQGQFIQLDVLQTILQILIIVVIPVCVGMLVRRYRNKFAHNMARPVRIGSGVVLALIIIGLVIKEKDNFVSYLQQAGLATLALNAITMFVGYYSAKLFRLTKPEAVSISIESGIQNGTLAITVAVVLLNNTAFAIAPAVYSLLMFFTGGFMIFRATRRKGETA